MKIEVRQDGEFVTTTTDDLPLLLECMDFDYVELKFSTETKDDGRLYTVEDVRNYKGIYDNAVIYLY